MTRRARRFIAFSVGALALVVVIAAAYLYLPPRQTADVAMPAAGATPEQVVKAYTEALDAHDCEAALALTTDDKKDSAKSWCEAVASLTDVEIGEHSVERPEWSGHSPGDQVAHVPVHLNLDWRPFHNDGSMDEGATTWGYLLMRSSPDGPWRIFDQGVG